MVRHSASRLRGWSLECGCVTHFVASKSFHTLKSYKTAHASKGYHYPSEQFLNRDSRGLKTAQLWSSQASDFRYLARLQGRDLSGRTKAAAAVDARKGVWYY